MRGIFIIKAAAAAEFASANRLGEVLSAGGVKNTAGEQQHCSVIILSLWCGLTRRIAGACQEEELEQLRSLGVWVATSWVGWLPRPPADLNQLPVTWPNALLWWGPFPPAITLCCRRRAQGALLASLRGGASAGQAAHAAAIFVAAAVAVGFSARLAVLGRHVIAEAWVTALGRWVAFDPGAGRLLCATYSLTAAAAAADGKRPSLSALELHDALAAGAAVLADVADATGTPGAVSASSPRPVGLHQLPSGPALVAGGGGLAVL